MGNIQSVDGSEGSRTPSPSRPPGSYPEVETWRYTGKTAKDETASHVDDEEIFDEDFGAAFETGGGSGATPAATTTSLGPPKVVEHKVEKSFADEWTRVMIFVEDDTLIPKRPFRVYSGIGLKLYLHGDKINPRLQLALRVGNTENVVIHEATADLHLDHPTAMFRNISITNIEYFPSKDPSKPPNQQGTFELTVNFYGAAMIHNCSEPTRGMSAKAKNLLSYMESLHEADEERILHWKVYFQNNDKLAFWRELFLRLDKASGNVAFFPYLSAKQGSLLSQFGMMNNAEQIAGAHYSDGSLFEPILFAAKQSYRNINEYIIHQANGEWQEWEFCRWELEKLKDHRHKVQFCILSSDVVLARLFLHTAINVEDLAMNDQVTFRITWLPEDVPTKDTQQRCKAVVVEDIAGIGCAGAVTMLVVNKFGPSFKDMASIYPRIGNQTYYCEVEAEVDKDQLSKQLASFERMVDYSRWHQLFLNQNPSKGPLTNPSDAFTTYSGSEKQAILEDVITRVNANDKQREAIVKACTELVAGASKVRAPAGTGKTVVSSAVIRYFNRIGAHVLGVSPSNPACDRLYQTVMQSMQGESIEDHPVRFHRWIHESSYVRSHGTESRPPPELDEQQQQLDETLKANAIKFALEVETYQEIRRKDKKRSFADPTDSLSHRVMELATEGTTTILGSYSGANDAGQAYQGKPKPTIDMMTELRKYMTMLESESISKWEDKDKKRFAQAFEQCAKGVVGRVKCLILTPAMITKKPITSFAEDAQGVFLVFEEAAMARDAQIVTALLGGPWRNKIVGMLIIGDDHQNTPVLATKTTQLNAFSKSLANPLFNRLETGHFPYQTLDTQYRSRPELIDFTSKRAYGIELKTDPSVLARPRNEQLLGHLRSLLPGVDQDCESLRFIDLSEQESRISEFTKSRSNLQQAVWIRGFVCNLLKVESFDMNKDMLIFTPYRDQKNLILRKLRALVRHLNKSRPQDSLLTMKDLPEVSTVDAYQGNDINFVLLSLVVDRADERADVGFLMDNNRMHMACTRAKEIFWILSSKNVSGGSLFSDWKEISGDEKSGQKLPNPMPYIGGYLRYLVKQGRYSLFKTPTISESEREEYDKLTKKSRDEPEPVDEEPDWGSHQEPQAPFDNPPNPFDALNAARRVFETTLYDRLEISYDAETNAIRSAFRKLSLIHHPDKNNGSQESTEKMQELVEAYEILTDEGRRSAYDQWGLNFVLTGQMPTPQPEQDFEETVPEEPEQPSDGIPDPSDAPTEAADLDEEAAATTAHLDREEFQGAEVYEEPTTETGGDDGFGYQGPAGTEAENAEPAGEDGNSTDGDEAGGEDDWQGSKQTGADDGWDQPNDAMPGYGDWFQPGENESQPQDTWDKKPKKTRRKHGEEWEAENEMGGKQFD